MDSETLEVLNAYKDSLKKWEHIKEVCHKWKMSPKFMPLGELKQFKTVDLLNDCAICDLMSGRDLECNDCPASEDKICSDDYDYNAFKRCLHAISNQQWSTAEREAITIYKWLEKKIEEF